MAVIEVSNLSKVFRLYHEKRNTVYENLVGALYGRNKYEDFVALKNVNFKVEKGETVGIIGGNGSGKSTLLKLIARILKPTSGNIKVNGRITPFLELGVGFQPELNAVENIITYGILMGLPEKEIVGKVDSILEFAELQKFRDIKIKNFSSGMYVRLAFSTAIQTNPEILLIDEVLAVGDLTFQQKCFDVFNKYREEGKTIVLVTHDLGAVKRFCDKAMLLRNGEVADFGKADDVIDTYIYNVKKVEEAKEIPRVRWGDKKAIITDVEFLDKFGERNKVFNSGDSMKIRIFYETRERIQKPVFGIAIHSDRGIHCYGTNTALKDLKIPSINGKGQIDLDISRLTMNEGKYLVTVAIHSVDDVHYDWRNKEFEFMVIKTGQEDGLFEIPCKWDLE